MRGRERERNFKELAHAAVGAGKSKNHRAEPRRLKMQGSVDVTVLSPKSRQQARQAGNSRVSMLQA